MTASGPPALPDEGRPSGASLPANLEPLAETARAYARAATSQNTNRAYAADWRDYSGPLAGAAQIGILGS